MSIKIGDKNIKKYVRKHLTPKKLGGNKKNTYF